MKIPHKGSWNRPAKACAKRLRRALLAAACGFAALAAGPPKAAVGAAYKQSFDKWKAELVEDRKQNWLTLAGLFWLKQGENSFGADSNNAIVFPKGPAHAGSFLLDAKDVVLRLSPDAHAAIAGKPVTTAKLRPDISGNPAVVEMGSLQFKVIVRGERVGIRLKDTESDAVKKYHEPVFFPLDLSYRVTAIWRQAEVKKTVDVPNVLGDVTPTPIAGEAIFTIDGQEYHLTDLGGNPAKGLFFVFNDLTSKTDTYPGGRFLDTGPVENGMVVLDFNRAYGPPCSVTAYATCPLAPKENRLPLAIRAGEKYDRSLGHHE